MKKILLISAYAAYKMGVKNALIDSGGFFKLNAIQPLADDLQYILLTNIFTLARITIPGSRILSTFDLSAIKDKIYDKHKPR